MTTVLVSIGVGILIAGLLYIILAKKIDRARSGSEVLKQIRSEVNQMIVELNQTADRNIGLVEQRIQSLTDLLEQADRKIKILQREIDRYSRSVETYSSIKPRSVTPAAPSSSASNTRTRESLQSSSRGLPSQRNGNAVQSENAEPPVKQKTKREQIIALYNQGISVDLIASRVNSTVAEVELIISIHEDKEA
jgi:hypothetical protein